MAAVAFNIDEAYKPNALEIEAAGNAARALSRVDSSRPIHLTVEGAGEDVISLPSGVFNSIVKMLVEIGNGHAVTVVPVQAELTTSQAADLLNMSRPHLIKLLERGNLPFRMIGTHRKLLGRDVLTYRSRMDATRHDALQRMADMDQEADIFDDHATLHRP